MNVQEALELLKAIPTTDVPSSCFSPENLFVILQAGEMLRVYGRGIGTLRHKAIAGVGDHGRITVSYDNIAQPFGVPLIYTSRQMADDALLLYNQWRGEPAACKTDCMTDPRKLARGDKENMAVFLTRKTTCVLASLVGVEWEGRDVEDCRRDLWAKLHDEAGVFERSKVRSFYYEAIGRATAKSTSASGPPRVFWVELEENLNTLRNAWWRKASRTQTVTFDFGEAVRRLITTPVPEVARRSMRVKLAKGVLESKGYSVEPLVDSIWSKKFDWVITNPNGSATWCTCTKLIEKAAGLNNV